MQKIKIKNSWRFNLNDSSDITIEFENTSSMMKFINSRSSVMNTHDYGHIYIIQMKKIKNCSLDVIAKKVNLREYNLERLLEI